MNGLKNSESGFSLVELLVAMAISGIVMTSVYSVFIIQNRSFRFQEEVTEMVQNARAAISMMSREIKMAGYNPTRADFHGVQYNPVQIEIKADLNGNGEEDELNEHVIYSYDAATKVINRNNYVQTLSFAENIQAFSFEYLDQAGVATTVSNDIRQIRIAITARTSKRDPSYTRNNGYRTYTLSTLVIPRNLAIN